MLNVYLSGVYETRRALAAFAGQVKRAGHCVTSGWLAGPDWECPGLPGKLGAYRERIAERDHKSTKAAGVRAKIAAADLADVGRADLLIFFAGADAGQAERGGRWVEFGVALGLGLEVWIVGQRERCFFAWLDDVRVFSSPAAALRQLKALAAAGS